MITPQGRGSRDLNPEGMALQCARQQRGLKDWDSKRAHWKYILVQENVQRAHVPQPYGFGEVSREHKKKASGYKRTPLGIFPHTSTNQIITLLLILRQSAIPLLQGLPLCNIISCLKFLFQETVNDLRTGILHLQNSQKLAFS